MEGDNFVTLVVACSSEKLSQTWSLSRLDASRGSEPEDVRWRHVALPPSSATRRTEALRFLAMWSGVHENLHLVFYRQLGILHFLLSQCHISCSLIDSLKCPFSFATLLLLLLLLLLFLWSFLFPYYLLTFKVFHPQSFI